MDDSITKQILHLRPAFDQAVEYHLSASGVGDIGLRQVHRQQATICVDHNMGLRPPTFLLAS